MTNPSTAASKMLELCKLLLDEDRLQIMGLLALAPRSQAELIAQTSMKSGVLARHLYQLQAARLISIDRREGVDLYTINVERIQALKRQLFAAPPEAEPQGEEEEVIARFVQKERLQQLPAQHTKKQIVLTWLAEQFHPGVDYPERAVNEILSGHGPDYATLRRALVDHGLLERAGGIYRRIEKGSNSD